MISEDLYEDFWWNSITGPRRFVTKVLQILNNSKIALLEVPSDLPWRHRMRGEIETRFRDKMDSDEIIIEVVDAEDDIKNEEPGSYILNRFAAYDGEIRYGYRESGNDTIQNYISNKEVIKNRIIWVKGLTVESATKWVDFCGKYKIVDISHGCFVLEIQGRIDRKIDKNIEKVRYEDYVTQSDVQLFNFHYLNELDKYGDVWKKYISVLASQLCDTDAEVSKSFMDKGDFYNDEPKEILKNIAHCNDFVRRGADTNSSHILSLVRRSDKLEIENRIWRAQLQVLLPIIEMQRVSFIKTFEISIRAILSSGDPTYQYNVPISDPYQVEWGTLHYFIKQSKLSIPEDDKRRFNAFYECRNNLAHVKCCKASKVKVILS